MGIINSIGDNFLSDGRASRSAAEAAAKNQAQCEAAMEAIGFIEKLSTMGLGVQFLSGARSDSKISNAEIIRIHATEGVKRKDGTVIKRSIYPGEKTIEECGRVFAKKVAKHMERIGKEYTRRIGPGKDMFGPVQQITKKYDEDKEAKQAGADALKSCAVVYRDAMVENLSNQTDSNGMQLASVTENYAMRRLVAHGVSPDAVFQATGQLENAFEKGRYVLYYDPAKIEVIRRVFG